MSCEFEIMFGRVAKSRVTQLFFYVFIPLFFFEVRVFREITRVSKITCVDALN